MTLRSALLGSAISVALAGSAFAEGCDKVIFSDVGWTDITATTAATSLIFQALGYEQSRLGSWLSQTQFLVAVLFLG